MAVVNLPGPPRLSGSSQDHTVQFQRYMQDLFNAVQARLLAIEARLDAISGLGEISDPPSATTTEIAQKANQIIVAATDQG